jgi:2-dehydropantoate 2-reductase
MMPHDYCQRKIANMNIGVMGAGAVGCYYGALLAKAGHAVTLIARDATVARIRAAGLRVDTARGTEVIQLAASADPAALAHAELVLFCVKSQDTERAGAALLPWLQRDASVLSFQNGADNAERLQRVLGREVLPAVLYVAVENIAPGHVRHHGRGDLLLAPSARSAALAGIFTAAGAPATVSEHVPEALWEKLIINCAYNALSAIGQTSYGAMVRVEGIPELMAGVVAECAAVAHAAGIGLPEGLLARVMSIAVSIPGQRSSTAQDLARGHATEAGHINGYVTRRGAELGVATPLNGALLALVRLLEASQLHAAVRAR